MTFNHILFNKLHGAKPMRSKIEAARMAAVQDYAAGSDGKIEIAANAEVQPIDTGIWVAAWVFISNDDVAEAQQTSSD